MVKIENISELIPRNRRSEKLSKEELRKFKKFVDQSGTKEDARLILKLSRPTLNAVLSKGSGKTETINKIRSVIAA